MIDLINAAAIALSGGGLFGIALECGRQLWERWRDRREKARRVYQLPRRAGRIFPDESDIEIALEIVNGKE